MRAWCTSYSTGHFFQFSESFVRVAGGVVGGGGGGGWGVGNGFVVSGLGPNKTQGDSVQPDAFFGFRSEAKPTTTLKLAGDPAQRSDSEPPKTLDVIMGGNSEGLFNL